MIAPPVVGVVLTEDIDTAAGALLHDPDMKNSTRMTEWSRLFSETPQYRLENMGREKTLAAALRLQCDGSRLQTNIQDMKLFLESLHEAAWEVFNRVPRRPDMVQFMRAGTQGQRRTMHSTVAICLWRVMNIPTLSTPSSHWFPHVAGG